ncbi:MAG: GNAT family N-acetyltransferase/peptidase C39 family protein [Gammaproteobacteria bacterium]|nr:GNAT family N-acetyltransferase/peptidase C39 family protein [Gammaproteobacteria bacterium]
MLRSASPNDLDGLVRLENRCFETDRLSRRNFRYLLTKGNDVTLVVEQDGMLIAYIMVLFNTGTSLARIYSFAVDPGFQGKGIGTQLLEAAEAAALENNCIALRLEIRKDNVKGIKLYHRFGFKEFGEHHDYYEDHMDAVRMEKNIAPHIRPAIERVPFYPQSLEFTCGPACLLMAMKSLDNGVELNRKSEIQLWRESTTVFMTSGHGGCDPYGLALAAHRRDFDVEIYVNEEGALFMNSVRSQEKKEVMRLVQEDFIDQIKKSRISLRVDSLSLQELQDKFEKGGIPVVLISSYRIYREKFPHWVVVTGFDENFIFVHDPYIDYECNKSAIDCMNMPIPLRDFERMARYGKSGLKAMLILNKQDKG